MAKQSTISPLKKYRFAYFFILFRRGKIGLTNVIKQNSNFSLFLNPPSLTQEWPKTFFVEGPILISHSNKSRFNFAANKFLLTAIS